MRVNQGLRHGLHHIAVELGAWQVDARSVEEYQLRLGQVFHAQDTMAGGLWLGGHDGQLGPHDRIEQRGFPDIRSPNDGDETSPERCGLHRRDYPVIAILLY